MKVWSLSQTSVVFLIVIFGFCWVFRYQRTMVLLEYYTHLIVVTLLFLVVVIAVSIVLRKASHVLLVGGFSIVSWFIVTTLVRFLVVRLFSQPYKILVHPDLQERVPQSKKVKLIVKSDLTPHDTNAVDAVVVDRKYQYDDNWNQMIFHANLCDMPVLTLKEYEELIEQRLSLEQLNESWMYAGFSIPIWYKWLKNTIEFLLSILLLPLLLIFFVAIAFIIVITMGRPIFYNQYRVGKNGKEFKIYKFRSMVKNSEQDGAKFATQGDMRITKFGAFMRKFRIDELPQFLNILKGDMSLIGPRPEQKVFVDQFSKAIPLYRLRHLVRPGITGWAQVMHGYASDQDETKIKLQYDLYYVKHYSLILDIKIVIKTLYTILTGFGAK
ncbi:exopolysaccharide biosynthesis polyprenyl glycosylphosphotransferase [Fangia hongkongensis]|nr:exopolysaccharide biosynthesis polyprenyl glycosylphosphotransferase [Fangia hongkongensis]